MDEHFKQIHEKYQEFQNYLLKNNILLSKDTGIGYWGVTSLPETFELFKRINLGGYRNFLDIGSGDGRIVLTAALFGIPAKGIEFDTWLVNSSIFIKRKLKIQHLENAKFLEDDFMKHDFSKFDIVFSNPDAPFYRNNLINKLKTELTGTLIVHGWEFHPETLKKQEEHIINGEKFVLYKKPDSN